MKVKIVNRSGYPAPFYATELSAGMDLKAAIEEPVELEPLCRAMIPTGLYIELPAGYEAQVRPRSGLAAKHGVTVCNSPGTIDAEESLKPDVVLIQLESFIDPKTIKGMTFSDDPAPIHTYLRENFSGGTLFVPSLIYKTPIPLGP